MKIVNENELKNNLSEYLKILEHEDVIVTFEGKPKAILKLMAEDDWEDYVIAYHPDIRASIQQAQQEIQEGKFIDLDTFIKETENAE